MVRRNIDEATGELTTSLSDARLAAEAAARRIEEEPDPTIEQLDEEVSTAGLVDLPIAEIVEAPIVDGDHDDEDSPGPFSGEVPAVQAPAPVPGVEDVPPPAPPVDISERRTKRGRRKKESFEGLTGQLTRIEPPAEGEGIRILAEPAGAPEVSVEASDETATEQAEADAPEVDDADAPEVDDADAETDLAEPGEPGGTQRARCHRDERRSRAEPRRGRCRAERGHRRRRGPLSAGSLRPAASRAGAGRRHGGCGGSRSRRVRAGKSRARRTRRTRSLSAPLIRSRPPSTSPTWPHSPLCSATKPWKASTRSWLGGSKRALADEQNEVLDLLRRAKPDGRRRPAARPPTTTRPDGPRWPRAARRQPPPRAPLRWAGPPGRSPTWPTSWRDRSRHPCASGSTAASWPPTATSTTWPTGCGPSTASGRASASPTPPVTTPPRPTPGRLRRPGTKGSPVRWVLDPTGGPCPDCDDNVLGGAVAKGDEFPTGHPCAPAHPGCRCLVVPAADRQRSDRPIWSRAAPPVASRPMRAPSDMPRRPVRGPARAGAAPGSSSAPSSCSS